MNRDDDFFRLPRAKARRSAPTAEPAPPPAPVAEPTPGPAEPPAVTSSPRGSSPVVEPPPTFIPPIVQVRETPVVDAAQAREPEAAAHRPLPPASSARTEDEPPPRNPLRRDATERLGSDTPLVPDASR